MGYKSYNWTKALKNLSLKSRSQALKTLDSAVKTYESKPTSLNRNAISQKFNQWITASGVLKREREIVANAVKYLPPGVDTSKIKKIDTKAKKSPYDRGVGLVKVKKDLKQIMKEKDGKSETHSWSINFDIKPTDDYGILVTVPIHAKDGRGVKIHSDNHYGTKLTSGILNKWSSMIGKKWMGAKFVYKDTTQNRVIHESPIKFTVKWASSPVGSSTVYCVARKQHLPGKAAEDGTIDVMYWGADDGFIRKSDLKEKSAVAHEFGHLLGNPDEYNTVTFQGRTVTDNGGIMDTHEMNYPKPGHFYLIGTQLADYYGYNRAQCSIGYKMKSYKVSNNHPWL